MLEVNPNLRPHGGWRFKDATGAVHMAGSFGELALRVEQYRARLGLPIGDPKSEITQQICTQNPGVCRQGSSGGSAETEGQKLASEVVANITALHQTKIAGSLIIDAKEVVAKRAEVCHRCKFNVDWHASACPKCLDALPVLTKEILGHREPEPTLAGRACLHARDDLSIAVHLFNPEGLSNVPEECWRHEKKNIHTEEDHADS